MDTKKDVIDFHKILTDIEFAKKDVVIKYPLLHCYKGLSTLKPLSKTYLLLCKRKINAPGIPLHLIFTERAVRGVYNYPA